MSVLLFSSRNGEQIEWPKSYFRECWKIRGGKIHAFSGLVSAYLFFFRSGEQIKWAEVIFLRISSRRIRQHQKILWSILVLKFKSMFCDQPYQCVQVHDSKKQNRDMTFIKQTNLWSITKLRWLTWCHRIQHEWYILRGMEYFCTSHHRLVLFSRLWVNNKDCRREVQTTTIQLRWG